MLPRTYPDQHCSIAGTLELIGDRWTLLVLRDAFLGVRRFDDFQADLGIARNVLSARLGRLVEAGLVERVAYQERPVRYEYRLTGKGLDLWPVLTTLMHWGDKHLMGGKAPVVVRHRGCGGEVTVGLTCGKCGAELSAREVRAEPGPGAATGQLVSAAE